MCSPSRACVNVCRIQAGLFVIQLPLVVKYIFLVVYLQTEALPQQRNDASSLNLTSYGDGSIVSPVGYSHGDNRTPSTSPELLGMSSFSEVCNQRTPNFFLGNRLFFKILFQRSSEEESTSEYQRRMEDERLDVLRRRQGYIFGNPCRHCGREGHSDYTCDDKDEVFPSLQIEQLIALIDRKNSQLYKFCEDESRCQKIRQEFKVKSQRIQRWIQTWRNRGFPAVQSGQTSDVRVTHQTSLFNREAFFAQVLPSQDCLSLRTRV